MEEKKQNQYSVDGKRSKDRVPKASFVVLIVFGVAVLLFGVFKITQGLQTPFSKFKGNGEAIDTKVLDAGAEQIDDLVKMQAIDTDGDGLSDYDEVYVYGTSAYLADTDSDGYSDSQEITSGHDPVCPTGKDCRGSGDTGDEEAPVADDFDLGNGTDMQVAADVKKQYQDLSATEVRELLLATGEVTQEQLDQVDDETLLKTFRELLDEQN